MKYAKPVEKEILRTIPKMKIKIFSENNCKKIFPQDFNG